LNNRYGGFFKKPLAVEEGVLVGDKDTLATYTPPYNTLCAGSGFLGTRTFVVLSNLTDVAYLAGQYVSGYGTYWQILTNYYPFSVYTKRALFWNTPILITSDTNSLVFYRNFSGSALRVDGTVSCSNIEANTKNFRIQHPIDSGKWLFHTSVESPNAELIYRGRTVLTNGIGAVNIDSYFNMTLGTFEALNKEVDVQVWNNASFDRVKASYSNGTINIECENTAFNNEVSFIVYGRRKDITPKLEELK